MTGTRCETIVNQCQANSCENNGTCQSLIDQYVCLCPHGFMGMSRSRPLPSNKNSSLGHRCETERNECEPVNPCLNSGRCVDALNNFTCICNSGRSARRRREDVFLSNASLGFTGDYCETQIDRCQSNPCLNGGICHTLIDTYKCDCPQGYTVRLSFCTGLEKKRPFDALGIDLFSANQSLCEQSVFTQWSVYFSGRCLSLYLSR